LGNLVHLKEDEIIDLGPLEDPITLRRFPKKMVGDCVACGKRDTDSPKAHRLSIEFPEVYIALCPEHEGELLEALLKNYLRRKAKGSKVGFHAPLVKPEPAELEEDEDLEFEED
jgi:hypothetical protein